MRSEVAPVIDRPALPLALAKRRLPAHRVRGRDAGHFTKIAESKDRAGPRSFAVRDRARGASNPDLIAAQPKIWASAACLACANCGSKLCLLHPGSSNALDLFRFGNRNSLCWGQLSLLRHLGLRGIASGLCCGKCTFEIGDLAAEFVPFGPKLGDQFSRHRKFAANHAFVELCLSDSVFRLRASTSREQGEHQDTEQSGHDGLLGEAASSPRAGQPSTPRIASVDHTIAAVIVCWAGLFVLVALTALVQALSEGCR